MSYIQLNGDDTEGSQEEFSVKVLYRESTYLINNITTATTVQQLKSKIAETTNVPISQQRLIFNGKSLQDNNTIEFYHIHGNSFIHLFPIPVVNATQVNSPSSQSISNRQVIEAINPMVAHYPGSTSIPMATVANLQTDAAVMEAGEPVRMWSFILVFTSAMTLFNFTMNFIAVGAIGNNLFDSIVNTFDALLSVGGMYIGQMGLDLFSAIDFDKLNKFVRLLIVLGTLSIILRFLWTADVILEAKDIIEANENSNENDADNNGPHEITESDLVAFTIQVYPYCLRVKLSNHRHLSSPFSLLSHGLAVYTARFGLGML